VHILRWPYVYVVRKLDVTVGVVLLKLLDIIFADTLVPIIFNAELKIPAGPLAPVASVRPISPVVPVSPVSQLDQYHP
jgi:hypothetical protein